MNGSNGLNGSSRWSQRGQRPVRVANCSGYKADPGYQMRRQAEQGDVDFITGDYLAEINIAENAEAMAAGKHPGYEQTAWDGIEQTIDLLASEQIKVVINGGAQNPKGLAEKTQQLVNERGLSLNITYIEGDNLLSVVKSQIKDGIYAHLDSSNSEIQMVKNTLALLDTEGRPIISANAYLGAREILKALELGADIVIAGRVADASPVIAAAWYWWSWSETDYDRLAGALVAGHLIECSAYVTGSNFAGFYEYPLDQLIDLPFGIAEIDSDGSCVVTKHENTRGIVTVDTVKTQFLYELQGNVYLNSDVKAYLDDVEIEEVGRNRVCLSGIRGAPPPPTTKLAIFYRGGFQSELVINATGYATEEKWQLWEKMLRYGLKRKGLLDKFDLLEFQVLGTPQENPRTQHASTTYMRIFAETSDAQLNLELAKTMGEYGMQHFSGFHSTRNMAAAAPRPFLAIYPALYDQNNLDCSVHMLAPDLTATRTAVGHPGRYEALEARDSYDTSKAVQLSTFGPTQPARIGDVCLARSGDKGPNLNFGIFVRHADEWDWLRSFFSLSRMKELMGDDWREEYHLERVEFPKIWAVHFVIYGILGRGVSSSSRLDAFGKGFADFVRDKWVDVPVRFLDRARYVGGKRKPVQETASASTLRRETRAKRKRADSKVG
ncbi:DUF1446 domain-containing protein [Rhizodiscina lignyota]|uniref:DUF1446 domain-containing protein n=1 Tax=Rhizodiscina lignyota TaxID=1504668 RepID=A0A9P4IEX4_9PEZI|nr:DUF1446 domain-containing protein [Rhizodiscina lignyota]